MNVERALDTAWDERVALHDDPDTDAYRLFDGLHEGLPGWTVDRYGPVAFVRRYPASADDDEARVVAWALARFDCVVVAQGARRLVRGSVPDPLVIREQELRFDVDMARGHNTGLFLDARPIRSWLREHASGLRVLNLFAYTCSLGVAAAAGGARSVTNVDIVPSTLQRGQANFRHNGLPADTRSFMRCEVFDYVRRASRRSETWDLVIADPPPVRTKGRGQGWDPGRDLPKLLTRTAQLLADEGRLLMLSAVAGCARFEDKLPPGTHPALVRGDDFPGPSDAGLRGFLLPRSAILDADVVHSPG